MLKVVHKIEPTGPNAEPYWQTVHEQPHGDKMPPEGLEVLAQQHGAGDYKVFRIDLEAETLECIERFTAGATPAAPPPPELTFE